MRCFNCGQDGHIAPNCRWLPELAADPLFMRRPADPPSAEYLAEKERLGMPAHPAAVALLAVACPWCDSGPKSPCVNRALGTPTVWHEARYTAAGIEPPRRPLYADVARRQVDEARAGLDKVGITI